MAGSSATARTPRTIPATANMKPTVKMTGTSNNRVDRSRDNRNVNSRIDVCNIRVPEISTTQPATEVTPAGKPATVGTQAVVPYRQQ